MNPFDVDVQETQEWLTAMEAVDTAEGRPRTHYLIEKLVEKRCHPLWRFA